MDESINAIEKYYHTIVEFLAAYSMQIIGALLIFAIGVYASRFVHKFMLKILTKYNLDITLRNFIANFFKFLVIGVMAIIAVGKLGISIAPFVAALGAISLTAGLALQGSVSNFAAGIVLIATKPFKIGDTITVHDNYGEVEDIKLAYTVLINEDGETITIPNKYMIGDILVNSYEYRLVEGSIGVAYSSDVHKSITLIQEVLHSNDGVSNTNRPIVGVQNFGDSAVEIGYRYWVPTKSYFKVQYQINLMIFEKFNKADIEIPFPQREVKIIQN